jgi:tetratricopeptide (TPR) repeat protein
MMKSFASLILAGAWVLADSVYAGNVPPNELTKIIEQRSASNNSGESSLKKNESDYSKAEEILQQQDSQANIISDLSRKSVNDLQTRLEAARKLREDKEFDRSESTLIQLLEAKGPDEIKRPALLELGLVMQEEKEYQKAQQVFSEYVRRYPKDPSVPDVFLKQAYLYREMGVTTLALSKFYAVISSCLNLQLGEMEYYQKLVLRAQAEIAETYYLQGKNEEAIDYFNRLLKLENNSLNRATVIFKLIRCYVGLKNYNQAIGNARQYLEKFPDAPDAPEAQFLLADSLKKQGQNGESLKVILALLESQHSKSKSDPQQWLYWQQRAGNNIANQLYREGDFVSALQIYQKLSEINSSPEWQMPVWYQIGLVYENLKQAQKASEMYEKVVAREKEVKEPSSSLKAVVDMAAWRKKYIAWEANAKLMNEQLQAPEKNL